MRLLTDIEVCKLVLFRSAGGLTPTGEKLYQQVMQGDLRYDENERRE